MPGPAATTKTLEQVQADLFKELCDNANSLVNNVFTLSDPPTTDNLKEILKKLARESFCNSYGYGYDGTDTTPSDLASGATVNATEQLCSITSIDQIDGYVQTVILGSENLSGWVRATAQADLTTLGKSLFQMVTGDSWSVQPFYKVYDSADHNENSVKTNAVFVYVNGSLTEDDIVASLTFLYYLGIYYDIVPPVQTAKKALFTTLCGDANGLLSKDNRVNLSSTPNVDDLTKILTIYGNQKFDKDFSFSYNGNKSSVPDGLGTKGALISGIETLCFIQDKTAESLKELLQGKIFSDLKLPVWANDQASTDLLNEVTDIFADILSSTWSTSSLERTYFSHNSEENAIKVKAELLCCDYSKTTDQGDVVNFTFLFYVGVYYEVESPAKVVLDDLVDDLCTNGNTQLSDLKQTEVTVSSSPTTEDLQKILNAIAKKRFSDTFGYSYNGTSSSPTDIDPNKKRVLACTAFFNASSPTDAQIKSFVKVKIADALGTFPSDVDASIKQDLADTVTYCVGETTTDNIWDYTSLKPTYPHKVPIETNAVFVFVNGTKNEESENDTTVTMSFVYYMGVYFNCSATADDADL
ncbi:hypothetical protein BYT27DRAFT_7185557 [Phlegmacium glaucopus]|nr:hypothetical protein BYT27DRAFT_7185557 [Phlegmacium glaucopus]